MERSSATPPSVPTERPTTPGPQARHAPLPSEQLLQGRRMVEIVHNGEVYRLQATRLGKLILTK
ncbi:hemin uptake protein HemP [Ramlibacter sp. USB13]|uniref:Hemin uptake protein HemP n=1 Tax=Ramlibacter cellulosilyticus TaxID=2764187 RepID=A0A923MWA4_9BURK|nr:hemin uptake protein HemP [Ramlibacter cellulosilyticus]